VIEIEIEGESRVLEKLEPLLRSSPRMLLQRGERYYELRSSEFDSEADPNTVRAIAKRLIRLISASCRLEFGLQGRILIRGIKGIAERKWASKADVENIFHTAQSPAILGDEARHGIQKGIPPSKPIGLEEAREVTAKIIRRWLAEKSAAKGWAASSGALRGKAEA